jgi:hypothetical protein
MLRLGSSDGRVRVEAINSLLRAACRQVFVVRELKLAGAVGKSTNLFLDKKNLLAAPGMNSACSKDKIGPMTSFNFLVFYVFIYFEFFR